MVIHQKTHED